MKAKFKMRSTETTEPFLHLGGAAQSGSGQWNVTESDMNHF